MNINQRAFLGVIIFIPAGFINVLFYTPEWLWWHNITVPVFFFGDMLFMSAYVGNNR